MWLGSLRAQTRIPKTKETFIVISLNKAEDGECRLWMLKEDCLDEAIVKLTYLLSSKDMCTASNAALVLARCFAVFILIN